MAISDAIQPKVSVVTITYNHSAFIRQTLEGFVAQQTDFPFEVIVADDHSTDDTQNIIKQFSEKYPSMIRPVLRPKNIGSQDNFVDALQRASGEYLALCDGDDYWTDPKKLQLQVDFMDRHQDYTVCFHPVEVVFEGQPAENYVFPEDQTKTTYSVVDLLKENFIQTNSVMYRRKNYDHIPKNILPLDWYLHLYHAQSGKIGMIPGVMGAYRRHPGGMWWGSDHDVEALLQKHGLAMMALYTELLKLFTQREETYAIYYRVADLLNQLMKIDTKYNTKMAHEAWRQHPEVHEPMMRYQVDELSNRELAIKESRSVIDKQTRLIAGLEVKNRALETGLQAILDSKSWKAARSVANAYHSMRRKK